MLAIRKHMRDFVAILGADRDRRAASSGYVLPHQRLRFPFIQPKPFELNAEFSTAQAVIAGQGQTVRVSGVRIGDIGDVKLKDGRAVVADAHRPATTRDLIHTDATALLRPKTGLKDMFVELDPGTDSAPLAHEGCDDPDRQHGARRQPGRDPLRARRRHARLPAAADQRRRQGPRRAAATTCATSSRASSRRIATSRASTAPWPSAAQNLKHLITSLSKLNGELARATTTSPASSTPRRR